MLDLNALDVDEIATALSDQTDYEHVWPIDPRTGSIAFWTSDTGIDGENPVDLDELDLLAIDPLPSHVWYADMADFTQQVSDPSARQRLARALSGRGAFHRFKDELYEEYPDLVSVWQAFRETVLNAEQSDGSSTKDSSQKPPPRTSPPTTPIPSFPDSTAASSRCRGAVARARVPMCRCADVRVSGCAHGGPEPRPLRGQSRWSALAPRAAGPRILGALASLLRRHGGTGDGAGATPVKTGTVLGTAVSVARVPYDRVRPFLTDDGAARVLGLAPVPAELVIGATASPALVWLHGAYWYQGEYEFAPHCDGTQVTYRIRNISGHPDLLIRLWQRRLLSSQQADTDRFAAELPARLA